MIFVSASREKIRRREEKAEGTEKRQVRTKKSYKAKKREKILKTLISIVVLVLVVLFIVFNSNLFYSGLTAIRMGDWKYTNSDFNYQYYNTFYNTYAQYYSYFGDSVSYLLDPKKPLDEQQYSDEQTYDDYFEETALNSLQQMSILYDMGKEAGFTLNDEQTATIKKAISDIKTNAAADGYSDLDKYLRAMYGKGLTEKSLTELLNISYYATFYSQQLVQQWKDSFTDEEKAAYYDSKRSEYDLITYYSYFVDGSADDEAGIDAETAMANALSIAQTIAVAKTEDTFGELVYNYCPEDKKETYKDYNATRKENVSPTSITNNNWKTWLTDPARVYGDTTTFEADNGYYVFMFTERNNNEYNLENYREIIIKVEVNSETGEITNETLAAAQAKVDEIIKAYNDDPTEENFISLSDKYATVSEDGTNNSGLYENVNMSMVSGAIADYVFSPDRTSGEVGYIYENETFYVFYTKDEGKQYNYTIAENLMSQERYDKAIADVSDKYAVNTTFAFLFAKKK
jgi:hypothetical protein